MQGGQIRCIASILVNTAGGTTDLTTLFGNTLSSHIYTLQADGAKIYVAFGSEAGTISESTTGTGETQCWPIPDGDSLPVRLAGSRRIASGSTATMTYHTVLHHKAVATATLRIYRSSLAPAQTDIAKEFPEP